MKRLWTVVPELYQDGYGGTIGAAGAVSATGRQCVTSCKLSDLVFRDGSWYYNFSGLDGGYACARETLSSLETKHHGRAGASSCCLSQQQSRRNYVH